MSSLSTIAPLLDLLNNIKPLSKPLSDQLIHSFSAEKISAGTVLLREGNVSDSLWFLNSGLLRAFHFIGEKEITSRLMFNGHIVISPGSFFRQTPATESVEALADCDVARLSFNSLQNIYERFPEFNYHTRLITEEYFYQQEQRLYMLRRQDAAAKYEFFLAHYSTWLKDIPQKYIATFLNMTPETLSRTRAALGKKQG